VQFSRPAQPLVRMGFPHPDTPLATKALGNKAIFTAEEQAVFSQKAVDAIDVDKLREKTAATDANNEGPYNNFWMDFGNSMNEGRRTSLINIIS